MLRKICESDAMDLIRWRNANAEFFPPRSEPLSWYEHAHWFIKYLSNLEDQMYMVCTDDGLAVGTVAISIRTKVIGRVMRGQPEGPGLMSRAIFELMDLYGPGTYQLQVLEGNERAIKFYGDLGFEYYGQQDGMLTMLKEYAV